MTDETTIITESGHKVPKFRHTPNDYLDKMTVIYGASGSGKSIYTKDILNMLRKYIDQGIVVCPTELTKPFYTKHIPKPYIHYSLSSQSNATSKAKKKKAGYEFLNNILQRQEMMTNIYYNANNLQTLSKLYMRIENKNLNKKLKKITLVQKIKTIQLKNKYKTDPDAFAAKVEDLKEDFKEMYIKFFKTVLKPYLGHLSKFNNLEEDEKYALKYFVFNPRIVLIFDDCADELAPYLKMEEFKKLFYRGRHMKITTIFCMQNETDLDLKLRKQVFVAIFTESEAATAKFERGGAQRASKATRTYLAEVIPKILDEPGHNKLVYVKDDDQKFYYYKARLLPNFKFGSKAIWDLAEQVKNDDFTIDKDNPFYDRFKPQL
jgi:ABC-type dipeptide/oligopeptide/nickel transport system ATPase component